MIYLSSAGAADGTPWMDHQLHTAQSLPLCSIAALRGGGSVFVVRFCACRFAILDSVCALISISPLLAFCCSMYSWLARHTRNICHILGLGNLDVVLGSKVASHFGHSRFAFYLLGGR